MFKRLLNPSLSRSFFLFGPRSSGKSTLLHGLFPESDALWIDLLDPDLERSLSQAPSRLSARLEQEAATRHRKWVVIDEIQKIPELLSVVHQWMQRKQFHFAMTGSSARKLKRGAANLLAGRASWFELSSLSHLEVGADFDLEASLRWGTLPEIFELSDADRARFLKSYCNLYLKEEVVAEQLVRKVQPFRNFLELVALQNSQMINYSKFARDCQVDVTTIQTYFEILVDTLVAIELAPFDESIRKRQRKNSKFYFFDTGVTRAMARQIDEPLHSRTSHYGRVFEQWVITEVHRLMKALEKDWRLSYLTTRDGAEVDLIIDRGRSSRLAIEIKSTEQVQPMEVAAFERLAADISGARTILISKDPTPQKYGRVECLPWKTAFQEIFQV
jgi:predicted AAA+ superfamily ATPase